MISVTKEVQIFSRQPISSRKPSAISANGNVCATKSTPAGESNLYDSTCCAKVVRFTEIENRRTNMGHKWVLGKKTFEMPAYTKIPPRIKRPIQMIARRKLNGLDCSIGEVPVTPLQFSIAISFLRQELLQKLFDSVVGHDAGIRISLALVMENRGRRLVDAIHLAQREIFVNERFQRASLDKSANLVHFRGREHAGNRAVHVARLLPLLLVLKKRLFHRFDFPNLRRRACVTRRNARVSVHGQREIAMNQVNLAGADVVVHEQSVCSGEERLARRTLVITELFHDHWGVFRSKRFVRIDVLRSSCSLGWRWRSGLRG